MSRFMTKPTKWLCAQQRLRSALASAQSDQSFRCLHEDTLGPQLPIKRTAKTLNRLGGCWLKPNFMRSLHGMGNESDYSNGLCHTTRIAAMPIYGKNLKKSSSLNSNRRWPWKLVCSTECSSTTKFIQMMTLCWQWPILRQGQIWSLMLLYGKRLKEWIFQKLL